VLNELPNFSCLILSINWSTKEGWTIARVTLAMLWCEI
jgi:hypothetical protein